MKNLGQNRPKNGFTGKGNDTIGPNQYKPLYEFIYNRPKGLGFSRMGISNITSRAKTAKKPAPGPGDYSFNVPTKQNFNSISYKLNRSR